MLGHYSGYAYHSDDQTMVSTSENTVIHLSIFLTVKS